MNIQYQQQVEQVLAAASVEELEVVMEQIAHEATEGKYHSLLPNSFDYWHYGRHAEFALQYEHRALANLFSMAWQHDLNVRSIDTVIEMEEARDILRKKFPYPSAVTEQLH